MTINNKPIIAITMGDAAGVGPEIIMKALRDRAIYDACRPFVIGDAKMLERVKGVVGSDLVVRSISSIEKAAFEPGIVECLDLDLLPHDLPFGVVSAEAGNAAFRYLEKAISLANEKLIDAICTAPLNKEALHKGGHLYPGHTEILAELTGTEDYSMMLSAPKLKVIHVTTHIGLIDAVKKINAERVYKVIKLAHETLQKAGYAQPRICVCGINPHAGRTACSATARRRKNCSRCGKGPARRHPGGGAAACGYAVFPDGARRFRHRGGDVPRSGPWSGKGAWIGGGREHYSRPADYPYQRGSRDCL